MKNRTKIIKSIMKTTFIVACIVTMLISGNAFAGGPERLIVEMDQYSDICLGVSYFNSGTQELLKGNTSSCMSVPSDGKLSSVQLMWMAGSRSDGSTCGGTKYAFCSGSTPVTLKDGAAGTVCNVTESSMYSSLDYSVSTTTCSSKKAWKVTFKGYHYKLGGIR